MRRLKPAATRLASVRNINQLRIVVAAGVLLVTGCSRGASEFPMSVGKSWTYNVRMDLVSYVEPVKVTRKLSVAGTSGYELSGAMGTSRLAWKDGTLYADSLINSSFEPSLPILLSGKRAGNAAWTGTMSVLGWGRPATATLNQSPETITIGGRPVSTVKSSVDIQVGGHSVEILTWYEAGEGPVRQEQRTDSKLIVSLEQVAS